MTDIAAGLPEANLIAGGPEGDGDIRLSGNLLGLDYGDKTVGVAFCDKSVSVAVGVEIIRRERPAKMRRTLSRICEICSAKSVDGIILGYPVHLSGRAGDRCEKTLAFKNLLEARTQLPVILWDERLTSVAAEEAMTQTGLSFTEQKQYVDELAAMLILQDYINAGNGNS